MLVHSLSSLSTDAACKSMQKGPASFIISQLVAVLQHQHHRLSNTRSQILHKHHGCVMSVSSKEQALLTGEKAV